MWQYVSAGSIEHPQRDLKIAISEKGDPVDITMAGIEILIVNKRASDIFPEDQVQKIRIAIKGVEKENHFILVVKHEIDCVDREKSEFEIWEENNKIRPDLAGKYRMISKIVIDHSEMNGFDIVRIKDFNVAVIVSEKIKKLIESNGLMGVKFKDV